MTRGRAAGPIGDLLLSAYFFDCWRGLIRSAFEVDCPLHLGRWRGGGNVVIHEPCALRGLVSPDPWVLGRVGDGLVIFIQTQWMN